MKKGSKANVSDDLIVKALRPLKIFKFDGSLKARCDTNLWEKAIENISKLGGEITLLYLRVRLDQNRNGIQSKLKRAQGLIIDSSSDTNGEEGEINYSGNHDDDDGNEDCQSINSSGEEMSDENDSSTMTDENEGANKGIEVDRLLCADNNNNDEKNNNIESDSSFFANESTNSDSSYIEEDNHVSHSKNCPKIKFSFSLTGREWRKIKVTEKMYKGRVYNILQAGWTSLFARKIYLTAKLPCAFAFNSRIPTVQEPRILKFRGFCKECGSSIYGESEDLFHRDTDEGLNIYVKYAFDTRTIPHKKKRRLAGTKRMKRKKVLKNKRVAVYQKEIVDELMVYGDCEPPDFEKSAVLRDARYEKIAEDLNIGVREKAIDCLYRLAETDSAFRSFTPFPFTLIYMTTEQEDFTKRMITIVKKRFKVSIDASGRFALPLSVHQIQSHPILLYVVVTEMEGYKKILPLTQMLTERHDTNKIKEWLLEFKRLVGIPDEVVIDGSAALANAVSLAFNKCTYKKYLRKNDDFLKGKTDKLPKCYIRLDKAHQVNAVLHWDSFPKKSQEMKDFYALSIGYSLQVTDFKLIEQIIEALYIISQNRYMDVGSACEKSINWLVEKHKNYDKDLHDSFIIDETKLDETSKTYLTDKFKGPTAEEENEMLTNNDIVADINKIIQRAEKFVKHDKSTLALVNPYWCPKLKTNIKYLFAQFPAWTNIMVNHYNSDCETATSARSEAYFKNLRIVFEQPIGSHKMALTHKKMINADMTLAKAYLEYQYLGEETRVLPSNSEKEILIEKNISESQKKKPDPNQSEKTKQQPKKGTKSTIFTEKQAIDPKQLYLQNGNNFINPLFIQAHLEVTVHNTCAFDSVIEVLANGYKYFEIFQQSIDQNKVNTGNNFFNFLSNYAKEGPTENIYIQRAQVLATKFSIKDDRRLDVYCGIIDILRKFLDNEMFSVMETYLCTSQVQCKHDARKLPMIELSFDQIIKKRNLFYLQEEIENMERKEGLLCTTCNLYCLSFERTYGVCICISLDYLFEKNYVCNLGEIPVHLKLNEQNYELIGAIEHKPAHFIANCRDRNGRWDRRCDLKIDNKKTILPNSQLRRNNLNCVFYIKS